MVRFGTRGENGKDSEINFYPSLCASDIKYLVPKIAYDGLNYDVTKTIRIYVKIFNPDGTMRKGSSSPTGYTYSSRVTVAYGNNNYCSIGGWGDKDGGSYSPGTYRIEFWYGGSMLYKQNFQLTEPLMVKSIDFANEREGNTARNFRTSSLCAKKVKYLVPRICYDGMASKSQKIQLYVKVFNPDGKLSKGKSSPDGYTYSCNVTIYPRKNSYCTLSGWGTASGGSYTPGIYRIEVWYDGRMLYKQNFELY